MVRLKGQRVKDRTRVWKDDKFSSSCFLEIVNRSPLLRRYFEVDFTMAEVVSPLNLPLAGTCNSISLSR